MSSVSYIKANLFTFKALIEIQMQHFKHYLSFQNSDYGLKIIDFGLAQELGQEGQVDIVKLQVCIAFF